MAISPPLRVGGHLAQQLPASHSRAPGGRCPLPRPRLENHGLSCGPVPRAGCSVVALDTSPSSCTLCAWNARGPSSQPGPAVRPPPPSQAASPQQFAVDAPPPREDFLHLPERGDTPRGTLVLAPASAGDGEAPEKRWSSGGRWARGAAPWSRGVGPATSWVTAWPVRPVPRGLDTSQLSRGRLVPPGQAAVFIGVPPPTARLSFGCGSSSERAQPCPRTLEPCRSPRASPGTHKAPSAPQRCLRLLDAGSHSREVAGPPHSAHGARALPPPGSPSSPSEVTFSGLALGVGRGGLDSGLWCGDLFPSVLPEA